MAFERRLANTVGPAVRCLCFLPTPNLIKEDPGGNNGKQSKAT